MKREMQAITLSVIILTCASLGFAQKAKPAPPARAKATPPTPTKTITGVRAAAALPSVGKHGGYVAVSADQSKTELGYMPIFSGRNGGLFLYAAFTNQVIFPELPSLELGFVSVSKNSLYKDAHGVTIIADGDRYVFTERDAEFYTKSQGEFLIEATGINLTYENLVRVANAKNVVVKIGPSEFQFAPNHLEALRDMARRMKK